MHIVKGRMTSQRCPHPNLQNLRGKKDFVNVIKLRTLRWGAYPGLSAWTHYNHKGHYKREAGGLESEKEM